MAGKKFKGKGEANPNRARVTAMFKADNPPAKARRAYFGECKGEYLEPVFDIVKKVAKSNGALVLKVAFIEWNDAAYPVLSVEAAEPYEGNGKGKDKKGKAKKRSEIEDEGEETEDDADDDDDPSDDDD